MQNTLKTCLKNKIRRGRGAIKKFRVILGLVLAFGFVLIGGYFYKSIASEVKLKYCKKKSNRIVCGVYFSRTYKGNLFAVIHGKHEIQIFWMDPEGPFHPDGVYDPVSKCFYLKNCKYNYADDLADAIYNYMECEIN